MRDLTFRGYLTQYVRQLAAEETNSLYKLAAEACSNNPRLREPLFLYAVYTQKEKVLLQATKEPTLYMEYERLAALYLTLSRTMCIMWQQACILLSTT